MHKDKLARPNSHFLAVHPGEATSIDARRAEERQRAEAKAKADAEAKAKAEAEAKAKAAAAAAAAAPEAGGPAS
jgi:hypothetical protein